MRLSSSAGLASACKSLAVLRGAHGDVKTGTSGQIQYQVDRSLKWRQPTPVQDRRERCVESQYEALQADRTTLFSAITIGASLISHSPAACCETNMSTY